MFLICIESSHSRGLGHLYRSLTLAEQLRSRGGPVLFLVNDDETSRAIIAARGFDHKIYDLGAMAGSWEAAVIAASPSAKVWVDDRLDTTTEHAAAVAAAGLKAVTFDDRGPGAALAELNISALIFEGIGTLLGKRVLAGPEYLVLNPEIARFRRHRTEIGSILVTLGGADTYGVSVGVAAWLAETDLSATVVTGPAFWHGAQLAEAIAAARPGQIMHKNSVPSLAAEMSQHDLAITGGGLTPFEAAGAGLPAIVIANELFEIPVGQAFERLGAGRFAGHHADFDLGMIGAALPIAAMSEAALRAVDLGGAGRVADAIWELAQ